MSRHVSMDTRTRKCSYACAALEVLFTLAEGVKGSELRCGLATLLDPPWALRGAATCSPVRGRWVDQRWTLQSAHMGFGAAAALAVGVLLSLRRGLTACYLELAVTPPAARPCFLKASAAQVWV